MPQKRLAFFQTSKLGQYSPTSQEDHGEQQARAKSRRGDSPINTFIRLSLPSGPSGTSASRPVEISFMNVSSEDNFSTWVQGCEIRRVLEDVKVMHALLVRYTVGHEPLTTKIYLIGLNFQIRQQFGALTKVL